MSNFIGLEFLDQRPIIIALAGSNGAGKSTFYHAHLAQSGLRFINADNFARELQLDAYVAADVATAVRQVLVEEKESFIFETVFSDPVGDKVLFLQNAVNFGYQVILIFIQIDNIETSVERVAMRVSQGGHDIPDNKLHSRFERTRQNLERAITSLPHVLIYDNSNLSEPYKLIARYEHGERVDHS